MQYKGKRKWKSFLFLKGVKGEQLAEKGEGGRRPEVLGDSLSRRGNGSTGCVNLWHLLHCFATSADDASVCMLVPGNMQIWRVWRRDRCAFPLSLCDEKNKRNQKDCADNLFFLLSVFIGRDSTVLVTLCTRFLA